MTTYNAGELQDLLNAKDVDLSNNEKNASAFTDTWAGHDISTEQEWWKEWSAMRDRYNAESVKARRYIAVVGAIPFTSLASYDATEEYDAVLASLNPTWQQGQKALGSFDDLVARLGLAEQQWSYTNPIVPQPIPQPNPRNDSGLGPDSWQAYVTGLGAKLGLVTNPPPGTPGTTGGPSLLPAWLVVGGIGAAGLWAASKLADIKKAF